MQMFDLPLISDIASDLSRSDIAQQASGSARPSLGA